MDHCAVWGDGGETDSGTRDLVAGGWEVRRARPGSCSTHRQATLSSVQCPHYILWATLDHYTISIYYNVASAWTGAAARAGR